MFPLTTFDNDLYIRKIVRKFTNLDMHLKSLHREQKSEPVEENWRQFVQKWTRFIDSVPRFS